MTNRRGDAVALDADHRAHAVQELTIRDLKHGAGLNHCPSGIFNANAAWLLASTLAHNLLRWIDRLAVRAPRPSTTKAPAIAGAPFALFGPDFYPDIWGVTFPPPSDYLLAIWFIYLGGVMRTGLHDHPELTPAQG